MAKKRKASQAKQARRNSFLAGLGSPLNTKGNIKNSALETGKDVLICVLGGGILGAAIGRPSLAVGIVTTGIGHYSGSKLTQLLGLGMMAANGFQKSTSTVSGMEGLDGVKERLQAYKENFSEKLYLDKFKKKTTTTAATTNGIGELQYFNYPGNDLAALSAIEEQIADSAIQFNGTMPELEMGAADPDEFIF